MTRYTVNTNSADYADYEGPARRTEFCKMMYEADDDTEERALQILPTVTPWWLMGNQMERKEWAA